MEHEPATFCVCQTSLESPRHWIRQWAIGQRISNIVITIDVSSCCGRHCAFQALGVCNEANTSEVSSVASGSHALHGWHAGPIDWYCDDEIA